MSTNNPPFQGSRPHHEDESPHWHIGENLRGALIMIFGSVALVGLAWAVMVAVTSPEGWVTKAAGTAMSGEPITLTSFADPR